MQRQGWDVRFVSAPFDPVRQIRDDALVIWRPSLPDSVESLAQSRRAWRRRGCLVLVEWDDHPDLFRLAIRQRCRDLDYIHLRCCHGVQTSNPRLASVLRRFNRMCLSSKWRSTIPPLRHDLIQASARVFLGNFNREQEQRQLASALRKWLLEAEAPQLVTVVRLAWRGCCLPSELLAIPLWLTLPIGSCWPVVTWPCCPCSAVSHRHARPRSSGLRQPQSPLLWWRARSSISRG